MFFDKDVPMRKEKDPAMEGDREEQVRQEAMSLGMGLILYLSQERMMEQEIQEDEVSV